MRKVTMISLIMLLTFNSSILFAHDAYVVHPSITESAVLKSSLHLHLQRNLNVKDGLNAVIPPSGNQSILEWLSRGSSDEDSPMCRAANHFHDPLKPWASSAMNDSPWWVNAVCSAWAPYYSNVTWATGLTVTKGLPITYNPGNFKSPSLWEKAKSLYYHAVTATTKAEREDYFAQTFSALGQVMHLLQDMSVPAHVRNDFQSHLVFTGLCVNDQCSGNPTDWFANPFEHYVQSHSQLISDAVSSQPLAGRSWLADFWDTEQYNGSNPSSMTTLGLAEITNANYFSDNTIPNHSPSIEHLFPHPMIGAAEFHICEDEEKGTANVRRYICRNNQSGPLAKITSVSFLNEEQTIANADLSSLRLVLDDNVHDAYARKLLPLAIDFSAKLLDHFFRGRVTFEIAGEEIKIRNTSGETMIGGQFELYYDNSNGERNLVTVAPVTRLYYLDEQTIPFAEPQGASTITVIYVGKLGNEENVVACKTMPQEEYALITVSLSGKDEKTAFVWDILNNVLLRDICVSTDQEHQAWVAGKTSIGKPIFSNTVLCGKLYAFVETRFGPEDSSCPELTSGMTDAGMCEIVYLPCGTWMDEREGPTCSCSGQGQGWSSTFSYDVKAASPANMLFGFPGLAPQSRVSTVMIPDSPIEKTGIRTACIGHGNAESVYGILVDEVTFLDYGSADFEEKWEFFGPLDYEAPFAVFEGNYIWSGGNMDFPTYVPTMKTRHFIPGWSAMNVWNWSDAKKAAYSKERYVSSLDGRYTGKSIVDVYMIKFTPCDWTEVDYQIHGSPGRVFSESWDFKAREIYVEAQAIFRPRGISGYDWKSAGRNASFESKILEAIRRAYTLNGVPENEVCRGGVSVEILN